MSDVKDIDVDTNSVEGESRDSVEYVSPYRPTDVASLAEPLPFEDSLLKNLKAVKNIFKKRDADFDGQIATRRSVFEDPDPEVATKYYPTPKWENFRAFDPYFRWTNYEDRKATLHTDLRVFSVVALLFFALNLDRGNLGSAVAAGLLEDINMTTNDYNLGNNLRSIGFIISEIPSQLIGKRFGPDWWIPLQVIAWSVVLIFQFFIGSKKSFWALRFLLGLTQGGFIADAVQYLSYFYTRDQMGIRLALFWVTDAYGGIVSNLLAIGFLKIDLNGVESWKWLFLFDGIITLALGILAFFIMVPGPTQTKTKFLPKGLFTEKEEKIIANRLVRDDPSKSDMHNREGVTVKQFFKTLLDYDLWPLLVLSLVFEIPQNPIKAYLNINLKALNFTKNEIIYLNIPIEVFTGLTLLGITALSEWLNERALVSLLPQIWLLIFIIIEYTSVETLLPWAQYVIMFFVISVPSAQAIIVSWTSRVSYSVRARAISSPMSNIGIQLAGIIGNNIYRADDAPFYHRGNRVLIGVAVMNIALFVLSKFYYIWRNKTKREKWGSFTEEQKEEYLAKHRDDGNKRLDYLFEH